MLNGMRPSRPFQASSPPTFPTENYEEVMSTALQRSRRAKTIWAIREEYERAITQAIQQNDRALEEQAWVAYISWERAEG